MSLQTLGATPVPLAEYHFPGYDSDLVPRQVRDSIRTYFASPWDSKPPDLHFDRVRPMLDSNRRGET